MAYPSEKYESQMGLLSPIYGKINFKKITFQTTKQYLYGQNYQPAEWVVFHGWGSEIPQIRWIHRQSNFDLYPSGLFPSDPDVASGDSSNQWVSLSLYVYIYYIYMFTNKHEDITISPIKNDEHLLPVDSAVQLSKAGSGSFWQYSHLHPLW